MAVDIKHQLRRPAVIIAVSGIVALAAIAYALLTSGGPGSTSYAPAVMGPIVETVSTTGSVKAAQQVDLSFQTSGRIESVQYDVGAHVPTGALLAALSSTDQEAQLEQAKANLAVQQAKLQSIRSGSSPESVAASQTAVANAAASLSAAQQGVLQAAQDAYLKSDDAIHNRVDQLFTNPRSSSPFFNLQLSDSQAGITIQSQRVDMEAVLTSWQAYVQGLSSSDAASLDSYAIVSTTRGYLDKVASYLDLLSGGLTHAIASATYPLSTIQGYEASVATARANLSTSLQGLNAAATALTSASSSLQAAKAQLTVTTAGATASDVAAQVAQVQAAQAAVDFAQAQIAKTAIYAPISGVIARNDAHVGSISTPGAALISILSDSKFQMETYVSEVDLGKVAVGQKASVQLDAYPGTLFPSHVIAIDPAATMQNGVASYKVTLQFDENDARIRSGLSGSSVITTHEKADALTVPASAIIRNGTSTSVLKRAESTFLMTPVVVGLSGGGRVEILSGLSAGDDVRTFGR